MIDFNAVLTDMDGAPIKQDGKDFTLGNAATHALLLPFQDEPGLSGEEKVKRFMLANKTRGAGITLTAEEIALIKKMVAKAYGPLIVGRAWQLLDPASVKVDGE